MARGNGPRTEDRGIEWLEDKWRTFKNSELGARYVYHVAQAFGFTDPQKEELSDDDLAAMFRSAGTRRGWTSCGRTTTIWASARPTSAAFTSAATCSRTR